MHSCNFPFVFLPSTNFIYPQSCLNIYLCLISAISPTYWISCFSPCNLDLKEEYWDTFCPDAMKGFLMILIHNSSYPPCNFPSIFFSSTYFIYLQSCLNIYLCPISSILPMDWISSFPTCNLDLKEEYWDAFCPDVMKCFWLIYSPIHLIPSQFNCPNFNLISHCRMKSQKVQFMEDIRKGNCSWNIETPSLMGRL